MGLPVVTGALLMCPFGAAPGEFMVIPINRTMMGGPPAANIMDHMPFMNVLPYGVCISMANPMVAAATAAALGVLVPMPCLPMTFIPWLPGAPTVIMGNMPLTNNTSKCQCLWGGVISPTLPGGSMTVESP